MPCTILTTDANAMAAEVHDRMPVSGTGSPPILSIANKSGGDSIDRLIVALSRAIGQFELYAGGATTWPTELVQNSSRIARFFARCHSLSPPCRAPFTCVLTGVAPIRSA